MEIGVRQPPCVREMGLEGFCEWAADEGFQAIDLPRLDAAAKKILDQHDLKIGTVDLPVWGAQLNEDKDRQQAGLAEQKKILDEAADLGVKVVFAVLLPEDRNQPRAKSFEIWREAAKPLLEYLEAKDLHLALEAWVGPGPQYPSIGCTPEMLRPMFDAIPSPNLGLCYDPSHLVRLGIDPIRFLWEFGCRVKHVHGKDTELSEELLYLTGNIGPTFGAKYRYGESAWRYTIPGEGSVDWIAVRNRLGDVGYDGLICVELEDHNYGPEVEKQQHGLVNSLRYLEEVIA